MTDKKLTDNEIKKALEYCSKQGITSECDKCKMPKNTCRTELIGYALDLINRLQAENEELKSAINGFRGYEDKIKVEACKECIEKVKALFPSDNEPYQYWEIHEGADNLLKELVGDDK